MAAVVVLVTNVFPFRQILAERAKVEAAQETLRSLTEENRILVDQVEALSTPAEIERLAREKLGYIRAGEEAYVVLPPQGGGAAPSVYPLPDPAEEPREWYERFWSYLSGADLSDG
jgi:cell division protein FtsL